MNRHNRIILVGREPEDLAQVTRILETAGYIVSVTESDGVAIDLAGSSEYDALFIGSEVPPLDRRYVTTTARALNPDMAVLVVQSPESVLTQLRQAGIERFDR
jgi:DNA-binding response OmpR family regulator